jgi:hypothetical protein
MDTELEAYKTISNRLAQLLDCMVNSNYNEFSDRPYIDAQAREVLVDFYEMYHKDYISSDTTCSGINPLDSRYDSKNLEPYVKDTEYALKQDALYD